MHWVALAGPAVEPVPLDEIRTYLRLDQAAEDDLVAALVSAARGALEAATRLAFISQTWRISLESIPPGGIVALPLAPILSVEAVRIVAAAGASAVSADRYTLDRGSDPARLTLSPESLDPVAAIREIQVDVTAGFGPAASDVPQPIRLAIRRLAARWYGERGDGARASAGPLDPDIAALVAPFARPRLV